MTRNRIGIFGGSFNPVHKGHIIIADRFIKDFDLDLLYVIPNHISPFKKELEVSGEDRAEMLKIAFEGNQKIVIGNMELKRGGTSYTCDTVADIKMLHEKSDLFLLIGDDHAESFVRWKNFRFILENATLVVAARGDKDVGDALKNIEKTVGVKAELLENQPFECSSSDFRARPDENSLPDGVYEYIKKRGLYGL